MKKQTLKPPEPTTANIAKSLGIVDDEWANICKMLGRFPGEYEVRLISTLWSEAFSQKDSRFLFSKYRGRSRGIWITSEDIPELRLESGASVIVSTQNAGGDKADIGGHFTEHASKGFSRFQSLGAFPTHFLTLQCVGEVESPEACSQVREHLSASQSYASTYDVANCLGRTVFHPLLADAPVLDLFCLGSRGAKHIPKFGAEEYILLYIGRPIPEKTKLKKKSDIEPEIQSNSSGFSVGVDPFYQRRALSAIGNALENNLIFQAIDISGIEISIGALLLAADAKCAFELGLHRVPFTGEEAKLADIIESRHLHRYLAIVPKEKHRELSDFLRPFGFSETYLGDVKRTPSVQLIWHHQCIAELPVSILTEGFVEKQFELIDFPPMLYNRKSGDGSFSEKKVETAAQKTSKIKDKTSTELGELTDIWLDMLGNPNLASPQPFLKVIDERAGLSTLRPSDKTAAKVIIVPSMVGEKNGDSPEFVGAALSAFPRLFAEDPYLGAVLTVADAMRHVAAVGANASAIALSLNFANFSKKEVVFSLAETCRGINDACRTWGLSLLSDSVHFDETGMRRLPVVGVFMLGQITKVESVIGDSFLEKGERIALLGCSKLELGGSEYRAYCHRELRGGLPEVDFDFEKKSCDFIRESLGKGLFTSIRPVSSGGVAVALATSCLSREVPIGARLDITDEGIDDSVYSADAILFNETPGRFLVSYRVEKDEDLKQSARANGIPITGIGMVGGKEITLTTKKDEFSISLKTAANVWQIALSSIFAMKG